MTKECWINDNGVSRKMTPEEVAEMEQLQVELPLPVVSLEEKVIILEQDNTSLRNDLDEMTLLMADMIGGAV